MGAQVIVVYPEGGSGTSLLLRSIMINTSDLHELIDWVRCVLIDVMYDCQAEVQNTSKRPPRERELLGNQEKKVALVKKIFVAFLNESFKLLFINFTE